MDIVQAVSGYITKMVSAGDSAAAGTSAAKMKILLLDNETVGLSALSRQFPYGHLHSPGFDSVYSDDTIRAPKPRSLPHRVRSSVSAPSLQHL